ncbi:MAG: dienelactone hydrolase family protein [Phycisphaeraceae bacterium]|nr:dienelactone hydrolase family protein [Phycisphaeraceae bacterium]
MTRAIAIVALVALLPLFAAEPAMAKIKTEVVEYQIDGQKFQGFLSYDDADDRPRPGVVVFPEWWGCNDYARTRAEMLAAMGYIAFAADMYGQGRTTADSKQAGAWAGEVFGDNAALRRRAAAALAQLAGHKLADRTRLAAIGYCMGGTVATELARTGADLKAVVAFHASTFAGKDAAANKDIKAVVMICHGAEDDFVKPEEITNFHAFMKEAGKRFVFISYSGAVHAFTNPNADKANIPSVRYNADADRRSWRHMRDLFEEVFAPERPKAGRP